MTQPDKDLQRQIALFRYGVIADLVHLPRGHRGIGARLKAKAALTYAIPGTDRDRIAANTIRGWLTCYRAGGFEALYPKRRADRGRARRLPEPVVQRLVELKHERPGRSVRQVIEAAREEGIEQHLAPATVHRLLERAGALEPADGSAAGRDRRRFAYREAGELWMADVMHGPKVRLGRQRRKTYLIGLLDDATRVVPYAAFTFSEAAKAFGPVLKQGLVRRGLPLRLYVDNGSTFRSRQLALVCAKLGIALIHGRPYQPAGRGKIERFFRTLRGWLGNLPPETAAGLEPLNRALWAWVEGDYHQRPHRGLKGRSPLEQWALSAARVRYPEPGLDLEDLFLFEARRRVMKDRTVSLHGRVYEVDALLVGLTVTLRYDPDAPPARPLKVRHDDTEAGQATLLDAYANTAVKRRGASGGGKAREGAGEPPPSPLAMHRLKEKN
jgi:transposase InsO family protein